MAITLVGYYGNRIGYKHWENILPALCNNITAFCYTNGSLYLVCAKSENDD